MLIRSRDVVRLCGLIKFIYCIKCYFAIKSASNIFNLYESFDILTKYMCTVKVRF